MVESASGVRLRLADGRELVDGMSSWWSAIHGYNHPVLDAAARDQLGRMSHVMFGGLTHEPAVRLASRLVEHHPRAAASTSSSPTRARSSVEVAVKMCLQYWRSRGPPGQAAAADLARRLPRRHLGSRCRVCDPEGGMHALWSRRRCPRQVFADAPPAGFDASPTTRTPSTARTCVERHADELAAVIVEPVVQGAGGMRFHSPATCGCCARLCDAHDVLLVFDEIATGFGRTGALFAAEHAGVVART